MNIWGILIAFCVAVLILDVLWIISSTQQNNEIKENDAKLNGLTKLVNEIKRKI